MKGSISPIPKAALCYQPPVRKRLRARDEVRAVVDEERPELAHKLPPKAQH
jgi:hypothetical protein